MKLAATNSFRLSRFSSSIGADHDSGLPVPQQAKWPVFVPSDALSSLSRVLRDGVWRGAAEFVGTFALVFVGAGAVLAAGPLPESGVVAIAFANGLAMAVMVSAVGHITGGHFNPAITLGFLVTGRLSPILSVVYWVFQLSAAVAAAALLRWIFPSDREGNLGAPALGPGIQPEVGLVVDHGQAELVGAAEHEAVRLRVGVEALELERTLRVAGAEADVGAAILGGAAAGPDAEVVERREAAGAGRRIARVGAEAERDVAIAGRDRVRGQA